MTTGEGETRGLSRGGRRRPRGAFASAARFSIVLAIAAAGCSTAPPPPPAPPAPPPAPREELLGKVRFELLADPDAPRPRLETTQEVFRPLAGDENRPPVYPPRLVGLALPPHVVALRFVVGTDGCVAEILPSPLGATTLGPWTEEFVDASETALRRWRYVPGAIRTFGPGPDVDGDGRPDWKQLESTTPQRFYYDVGFGFEIVRGEPVVTAN